MFDTLKHYFLPHHTNNFRAKLLHFDVLLLITFVLAILGWSFRTVENVDPGILGYATDIRVERLLELTNQKRAEQGLAPLSLNGTLSQAASLKAGDMFANNYWAHTSPAGKTPWDFISSAGYVYSVAGENLAKNFSNSEGVVEAWMNSPSHKENLLRSQYQEIGFAIVNGTLNGEETTLVVQMFGKPVTAIAQAPKAPAPAVQIAEVQAAEETVEVVATPEPIVEASPEIPATVAAAPVKEVEITPQAPAVVKQPLFDVSFITKNLSLIISLGLLMMLIIDALYVWKKGIVRVSGRSFAHIMFLVTITGFIWVVSVGSIL